MRADFLRIGNTRGIRNHKPILEQVGILDAAQLKAEKGRLIILPDRAPRWGWEEAFTDAGRAGKDLALLGEIAGAFDRYEWTW